MGCLGVLHQWRRRCRTEGYMKTEAESREMRPQRSIRKMMMMPSAGFAIPGLQVSGM